MLRHVFNDVSLSSRNMMVGYQKQVGDPETKIKIRFSCNEKMDFS